MLGILNVQNVPKKLFILLRVMQNVLFVVMIKMEKKLLKIGTNIALRGRGQKRE
jgi:hypothetical protein